jgi:hypothetical protein
MTTSVYENIEKRLEDEKFLRRHGFSKYCRHVVDNEDQNTFDQKLKDVQKQIFDFHNDIVSLVSLLTLPEDKAFYQEKVKCISNDAEQAFQTARALTCLSDRCLIMFVSNNILLEEKFQTIDLLQAILKK